MELINAGAHTDYVNRDGECPSTGYLKSNGFIFYNTYFIVYNIVIFLALFHLTNKTPTSLKCLSARVLKYQCPKESYQNQLPQTLEEFTNLH